jgi:large subunit ribosomal protein L25
VKPRTHSGTGGARAVRREGLIPGIIYGETKEPEMISVDIRALTKEYHQTGFFSRIYKLSVAGAEQQVIVRDVQVHPVTDVPLHVDFQRVSKGSKVHVSVSITFINEDKAPGLKKGGVLNTIVHALELVCAADQIPEKLVVDLTGLEMNNSIHIDALKLPEGVVAAHPERDHTLATIVAPSIMVEEKPGEAAEAAAAEGEQPAEGASEKEEAAAAGGKKETAPSK